MFIEVQNEFMELGTFGILRVSISDEKRCFQVFNSLKEVQIFHIRYGQVLVEFSRIQGVLLIILDQQIQSLSELFNSLRILFDKLVTDTNVDIAFKRPLFISYLSSPFKTSY